LIQDVDVSKSGVKGGTGVHFEGCTNNSFYDNNVVRVDASNRLRGVYFYSGGCGNVKFYRVKVVDSNFVGDTDGILSSGSSLTIYDLNVFGNDFSGVSGWAVSGNFERAVVDKGNNFLNAANGLGLGSGVVFDGWDFRGFNIAGTVLSLSSNSVVRDSDLGGNSSVPIRIWGGHNLVEDVDVSKSGVKGGTGVHFEGCTNGVFYDNNVVGVDASNRVYGVRFYSGGCGNVKFYGQNIIDSNFVGNTYGIFSEGGSLTIYDFNINHNNFTSSSTSALQILHSSLARINGNDFVSNSSNASTGSVADANYNYWSNHTCGTCNAGICSNQYAFTGGRDNSPYCSPVS
jgi:hypothetical protein